MPNQPENSDTGSGPETGAASPRKQLTRREDVSAKSPAKKALKGTPETTSIQLGVLSSLIQFLDRNMGRFSPVTRDFIGILIAVLAFVFVINGFMMPTYVRGQIFIDGKPAEGVVVAHPAAIPMTSNAYGYWMLPITHGSLPFKLRLDFKNQKGDYMGFAEIRGPWPIWSALFPMDYAFWVEKDQSGSNRIRVDHIARVAPPEEPMSVFAQNTESTPERSQTAELFLDGVRVKSVPGLLRSSGRVFMRLYLDGKRVPDNQLLIQGVPFPLESQKEAWLPVRAGADEHFAGYRVNIGSLARVQNNGKGPASVLPLGTLAIELVSDNGDSYGNVNIASIFAARGQSTKVSPQNSSNFTLSLRVPAEVVPPTVATPPQTEEAIAFVYLKQGQSGFHRPSVYLGPIGNLAENLTLVDEVARVSRGRYVAFSLPVGKHQLCIEKPAQKTCTVVDAKPAERFYFRAALGFGSSSFALNPTSVSQAKSDLRALKFVDDNMIMAKELIRKEAKVQ